MAQFDPQHIITCPGIILWDGISTPNIDEKDGAVSHSLKIAIPENAPEKMELEQLAMATLILRVQGTIPRRRRVAVPADRRGKVRRLGPAAARPRGDQRQDP